MNLPVIKLKDQQPEEPKTYKVGQTFKHKLGTIYQLQLVGRSPEIIQLSTLANGARWGTGISVSNCDCIIELEFHSICHNRHDEFTPVEIQITEL